MSARSHLDLSVQEVAECLSREVDSLLTIVNAHNPGAHKGLVALDLAELVMQQALAVVIAKIRDSYRSANNNEG